MKLRLVFVFLKSRLESFECKRDKRNWFSFFITRFSQFFLSSLSLVLFLASGYVDILWCIGKLFFAFFLSCEVRTWLINLGLGRRMKTESFGFRQRDRHSGRISKSNRKYGKVLDKRELMKFSVQFFSHFCYFPCPSNWVYFQILRIITRPYMS